MAASGSEDDDPMREPRAYNNSILLMVAMPYLLLGGLGLLIYRSILAAGKNRTGPPPDES